MRAMLVGTVFAPAGPWHGSCIGFQAYALAWILQGSPDLIRLAWILQ